MKYALNKFTLTNNEPVIVQGSQTLFTYQNTGSNTALIQGSNDAVSWFDIVALPANDTHIETHSYQFLRMTGNTEVIVNRGITQNGNSSDNSGGFSFGGHYDATPTIVTQDAEFNAFDNAAIVDSQFVPNTPYGVAYAQSVNTTNNDTDVYFEFIYPNVVAGVDIFLIGLSSVPATAQTNLNNVFNPNNAFIAFGNYMNYETVEIKDGNFNFPPLTASTPSTGDVIRVELQSKFTTAAGRLTITNITTSQEILNYGLVNNPLVKSLVIVGNVPIELTLNTASPMEQSFLAMPTLPQDLSKTYYISGANEQSYINNKLLKVGDFVNFYDNSGFVDVVISRLMTDTDIEEIIANAINSAGSNSNLAVIDAINTLINTAGSNTQQFLEMFITALLTVESGDFYTQIAGTINSKINEQLLTGGTINEAIQAAVNP